MRVLSIQSCVSYGHVGNSAAVFPLQRLGHEVMPVHTVVFSNHTGYGAWGGQLISGDVVRDIVKGIDERGGLDDVELVLSGYQGGNDIGDAILEAVALVKERNPQAIYACDPVLGSATSGCFVAPEVQTLIRDRVVPQADRNMHHVLLIDALVNLVFPKQRVHLRPFEVEHLHAWDLFSRVGVLHCLAVGKRDLDNPSIERHAQLVQPLHTLAQLRIRFHQLADFFLVSAELVLKPFYLVPVSFAHRFSVLS